MPHNPFAFVSAEVCRRLVDVEQVVRRIEEVYLWEAEGGVMYAPGVALRMFHAESSFKTHTKAVILPRLSVAGVRVVGYHVQGDGSGPSSPQSTRLVLLMDLESGSPLALVDEHYNYTLRTAASVAVAAVHLSPPRPVLGLVGAGGVAQAVARVFSKVLPIEEIYVTSRRDTSPPGLRREIGCRAPVAGSSVGEYRGGGGAMQPGGHRHHLHGDLAQLGPGPAGHAALCTGKFRTLRPGLPPGIQGAGGRLGADPDRSRYERPGGVGSLQPRGSLRGTGGGGVRCATRERAGRRGDRGADGGEG